MTASSGIEIALQALSRLAWNERLRPIVYDVARRLTNPEANRRDKMRALVDYLHERLNTKTNPVDQEVLWFLIPGDGPMDADDACLWVAASAMSVGIRCRFLGVRYGHSWTCQLQYEVGDHWETIDPLWHRLDLGEPDERVTGPDPQDP